MIRIPGGQPVKVAGIHRVSSATCAPSRDGHRRPMRVAMTAFGSARSASKSVAGHTLLPEYCSPRMRADHGGVQIDDYGPARWDRQLMAPHRVPCRATRGPDRRDRCQHIIGQHIDQPADRGVQRPHCRTTPAGHAPPRHQPGSPHPTRWRPPDPTLAYPGRAATASSAMNSVPPNHNGYPFTYGVPFRLQKLDL
jgi:hypothetical protein